MNVNIAVITLLISSVKCRDFYVGMFKRNDYLVAQDRLYKERVPYRFSIAKYGRLFKCPLTYFRVVDRLGLGTGPRVQITRGGLGQRYLTLRITSTYNNPVSVNIYVGCSPESTTKPYIPPTSSGEEEVKNFGLTENDDESHTATTGSNVTSAGTSEDSTKKIGGDETSPNDKAVTAAAQAGVTAAAPAPAPPGQALSSKT